jgi:glyoxylase-like metal-dependent hydrolase (beta-lactamase superfamily II)/8-oxo-dGTP pyrophosphatase MutT (NUDIX family)
MSTTLSPAVAAALVHEGQVLVIQRAPQLLAFPGFHALPGGKIEAEDAQPGAVPEALGALPPSHARALLRELAEELGAAAADATNIAGARLLGRAMTPPGAPRRFDTHFYALTLKQRPALSPDAGEIASAQWQSVAYWQQRYRSGELLVVPPILSALQALDDAPEAAPFLLDPAQHPQGTPFIEHQFGLGMMPVRSHTLPPAEHTNCFLLGDAGSPRLLVDPSPADAAESVRLLHHLQGADVTEVFITHRHPDHHQGAAELARALGARLGMSALTAAAIRDAEPAFFDGLELRLHEEGAVLTRWLGQPVRALAVPGHDAGQLALMPDNRAWCIVSDLIQGIGTVVIARPEGNMGTYFRTLQRLIELDPRVVYPSHGSASATTLRLSQTLQHRQQREAQVLALHAQGLGLPQMLESLYPGLPTGLLPLARMNLEGHLDKLREEGALA